MPANSDPLDLNAPDIGAAYLPQNQDPTAPASAIPGARAVATDLMRPYRGLGAIIATWPIFYTQYDSLQTSFNRRFRNGWQAGVNWTLSLRHGGNTFSPQHLLHNADGTIGLRPEQDAVDEVLSNAGLRRHLIKGNFVWDLPDVIGRQRGVENPRRRRERLAAVGRLHRRQRRALRRRRTPTRPRART